MSEPKQIDDGGPAFPVSGHCVDASGAYCGDVVNSKGLSLRDWFAGQALAGDMAAQNDEAGIFGNDISDKAIQKRVAIYFRFADAMIAARKEKV